MYESQVMDTNLTFEQICLALRNCIIFNKRNDIMIPNLSWGLLDYEADFVAINRSGYMTEIEVKRSWEDFKADFRKLHTHNDARVYRFAYCVPQGIAERCVTYIRESNPDTPDWQLPAVIYYTEDGEIGFSDLCVMDNYHAVKRRKLFLEEMLTVARLGQIRYWNLLEKINEKKDDN